MKIIVVFSAIYFFDKYPLEDFLEKLNHHAHNLSPKVVYSVDYKVVFWC